MLKSILKLQGVKMLNSIVKKEIRGGLQNNVCPVVGESCTGNMGAIVLVPASCGNGVYAVSCIGGVWVNLDQ
ncbi:hypothetical protein [uncultured Aquimarina sp.]|uniref:hypothetical protein n=1 Tax=uncultured Aquimarina sp. TaxID=575652 RepID=UPI00261A0698|nr:hypothetical protein [uncultured Aquimarina sp.]